MFNVIGLSKLNAIQMSEKQWWKPVTLGVVFILWVVTETSGHNWGGDFSQYIYHAINLVEGRPYADIGYIHNSFAFVGPATYPPVFSFLLAPVYLLFGFNLFAFKVVVVACFCLALYFSASLGEKKLDRVYQFAIIITLALNPYFWVQKDRILSDFLFLLICLLTLSVLNKRYIKAAAGYRDTKNKNWSFAVLLGLLLYLNFATREIGIVFIPAILCFELFHFKKISLVTCYALFIFVALYSLQSVSLKAPEANIEMNKRVAELAREQGKTKAFVSHTDFINLDITNILKQAVRYTAAMSGVWPGTRNIFVQVVSWVAFLIALLFACAGYIRAVLSGPGITEIFVAGYLAVLVLFAGFQGLRYFIPLIPIFFFYAYMFHQQLLHSRYRKTILTVAAIFIATTTITYAANYQTYLHQQNHGITSPETIALVDFIKKSTPEDSVFVFQKPRTLALLTRREVSAKPGNRGDEFLVKYMTAIGADYLVHSNIDWRGISHPVKPMSLPDDKFSLVYNNDYFYVYRRYKK